MMENLFHIEHTMSGDCAIYNHGKIIARFDNPEQMAMRIATDWSEIERLKELVSRLEGILAEFLYIAERLCCAVDNNDGLGLVRRKSEELYLKKGKPPCS